MVKEKAKVYLKKILAIAIRQLLNPIWKDKITKQLSGKISCKR
jgi:hypothetical protein